MRSLPTLLLPFLLLACTHRSQVVERHAAEGTLLTRITWLQGRKHGEALLHHASGTVAKRGRYAHDLKDGTWEEFAPDGTSTALLNYAAGKLHGHCRWMAPNGQVLSDERYMHGQLDGHLRRYFPDGRLRHDITYRMGRAEGAYWRHMDAHEDTTAGPIITGHYRDGVPHGLWRGFTGDGRMTSEGGFVHGHRVGIWRHWDRSGRPIREDEFDAEGRLVESRKPAN